MTVISCAFHDHRETEPNVEEVFSTQPGSPIGVMFERKGVQKVTVQYENGDKRVYERISG